MANACLATGLAPSEFLRLSQLERQAFVDEHNANVRRARRK